MTEEIIIDGVNVSECCFYNNSKCDNPNGMACNCINNAVCYFKELKRLEQELDVLKGKYFLVEQESINKSKTICDLERENKELKKQIESQKGLITVGGKQQYEMTKAYDKCKTALEEIRNDIMFNKSVCTECIKIAKQINEVLK